MVYQLQGEPAAAIAELEKLQSEIEGGSLEVLDRCDSEDELEFIFPELHRIQSVDRPSIDAWKAQIEWWQTQSPEECEELQTLIRQETDDEAVSTLEAVPTAIPEPSECRLYREYCERTTSVAVHASLYLTVEPKRRDSAIEAISLAAEQRDLPLLSPSTLALASDLALVNLHLHLVPDEETEDAA